MLLENGQKRCSDDAESVGNSYVQIPPTTASPPPPFHPQQASSPAPLPRTNNPVSVALYLIPMHYILSFIHRFHANLKPRIRFSYEIGQLQVFGWNIDGLACVNQCTAVHIRRNDYSRVMIGIPLATLWPTVIIRYSYQKVELCKYA